MGVWEVEPEVIAAIDKALATMAVISAFALAPLLPFADPISIASGGSWFALGAALRFFGPLFPARWSIVSALIGAGFFVAAAVVIVPAAQDARNNARANARRCAALQADMLSSAPLRANDADVFQALGCKPQGEGSVYADGPTDELDRAISQASRRANLPYKPAEK